MQQQKSAYIYAGLAVLLWSTVASAFKLALGYINHIQLLCYASFFSTLILFIIIVVQKKLYVLKNFSYKEILHSLFLGFLNPFLYYLVLFKAYSLLPAQVAQPLNQTWAVVLSIFSIIVLKQKIKLINILALLISYTGVLIISSRGNITKLQFINLYGVALALGSAFIWSLFWLYNIKNQQDIVVKLFFNFLCGSLCALFLVLVTNNLNINSLSGLFFAGYVGCFEMGVTFILWLKALKLTKTTVQVSNMIYLVPFISLVLIHFLVGEKILITTIIGLIFIISGILLQRILDKRAQSATKPNSTI